MASYVYGNTAHKTQTAPKRPVQKTKEVSKHVQQNRSKALHMSKGYVAFLAVATSIILFACVQYLQLQAEVTRRAKNITVMQQELADDKEANTVKYNDLIKAMNLEEIRDKAINELGMVSAQPGQIIRYKNPADHAVTQYAEIPESGVVASSDEMK